MGFNKRKDATDTYGEDKAKGIPNEGSLDYGMSTKAMRGLPKSAYSVLADPYEASLPTSKPYPILTTFNKKVGGSYAGGQNLDGGNVLQYPNSTRSSFLKITDFMRLKIDVNYRYKGMRLASLPNTEGPDDVYVTSGLIDQARSAISEATSVLSTTTFTQMAIWDYVIETDLPMGKAKRKAVTIDSETHYVYTNINDVIYAALTFYQLVIQDSANMINWINSFRLKQGVMLDRSWNREVAILNGLFSMFNKKAFLGILDGICLQFPGDYVDVDWVKQMNMMNTMPSARSNAMFDPVLELQTRCVHPSVFKMYIKSGNQYILLFDMNDDFNKNCPQVISDNPSAPSDWKKTFWNAIDDVMDFMSAQNTMQWARNQNGDSENTTQRFNLVKWNLDVVTLCLTTFKTLFNDIRDTLDTLSRTGLNTWTKGFRPSVTRDTNAPLFDNSIVADIYKTVMSGADTLVYNEDTKRWRFFTLWNMYNGIPEYDAKVGGCFLSMSAKELSIESDSDDTRQYLPIAFFKGTDAAVSSNTPVVYATTRSGHDIVLTTKSVTMANTTGLKRLVPLPSQASLKLRVPYLDTANSGHDKALDDEVKCYLDKTLLQIFNVCESAETGDTYLVDSDIIAIYQVEIQDITNDAIAYARLTGPFKGAVSDHDEIGFSKFGTQ